MKKVYIHTNNKQYTGALIAKYAIESNLRKDTSIGVEILNMDEVLCFQDFNGTEYLFTKDITRTYDAKDLQSFTLSRFMPPELMGYQGKAIVIDPDVFFLCDVEELFSIDMEGKGIATCEKKGAWDTSVMLLDCSKLQHWSIETILKNLREKKVTYSEIMALETDAKNENIIEIPRIWNHLDTLTPETKAIHMTGRLTQPWKTGLPIDFTINKMPKYFGIIPREPIHKLLGKTPTHYQRHPNPAVEKMFFDLAKRTMEAGVLNETTVQKEIAQKYVREDFLDMIYAS